MFIVLLVILLIVALGLCKLSNRYPFKEYLSVIATSTMAVALVSLVCSTLLLPILHMTSVVQIEQFKVVQSTIDVQRENAPALEQAALTNKTIEWNTWLIEVKYWNDTFLFDWYYCDDIEDLKLIQ